MVFSANGPSGHTFRFRLVHARYVSLNCSQINVFTFGNGGRCRPKTPRWRPQGNDVIGQLIMLSDAIGGTCDPASVAFTKQPRRAVCAFSPIPLIGRICPNTTTGDATTIALFILNRNVRGVIRSAEWIAIKAPYELYDHQPESDDADTGVTWYWPNWYFGTMCGSTQRLNALAGRVSHWTGCTNFPPDHADYDMWRWIVFVPQYHRLV